MRYFCPYCETVSNDCIEIKHVDEHHFKGTYTHYYSECICPRCNYDKLEKIDCNTDTPIYTLRGQWALKRETLINSDEDEALVKEW